MGSGSRIYIGHLPYGVRERDIEKFFKGFGRIREILLKNGYGFIVSNLECLVKYVQYSVIYTNTK